MREGIISVSTVPLRAEPNSRSEILSFLLFGERYSISENPDNESWIKVQTLRDGYTGYISADQHSDYNPHVFEPDALIWDPLLTVNKPGYPPFLCAGSEVVAADFNPNHCAPLPNHFKMKQVPAQKLIDYACSFLGIAYLWGGRSAMGMDCSGLIQILFKLFGVALPRDSSKQYEVLPHIEWTNLMPGDLVFFASKPNSNKVMHVGLFLGDDRILHASGKVKIDALTPQGIVKPNGKYSHYTVGCARCA